MAGCPAAPPGGTSASTAPGMTFHGPRGDAAAAGVQIVYPGPGPGRRGPTSPPTSRSCPRAAAPGAPGRLARPGRQEGDAARRPASSSPRWRCPTSGGRDPAGWRCSSGGQRQAVRARPGRHPGSGPTNARVLLLDEPHRGPRLPAVAPGGAVHCAHRRQRRRRRHRHPRPCRCALRWANRIVVLNRGQEGRRRRPRPRPRWTTSSAGSPAPANRRRAWHGPARRACSPPRMPPGPRCQGHSFQILVDADSTGGRYSLTQGHQSGGARACRRMFTAARWSASTFSTAATGSTVSGRLHEAGPGARSCWPPGGGRTSFEVTGAAGWARRW